MPTETQEKAYEEYQKKPTSSTLLNLVRSYQREIDNAVYGMAGPNASQIVRRRAYVMAAQAVQSYDPKKEIPLKNYLMAQLQPVTRMARQIHEPISIPERHRRYQALLAQSREELYDKLDREPSMGELADHTGLSVRQQKRLQGLQRGMLPESTYVEQGDESGDQTSLPGVDKYDPRKEWEEYVYHDLDPVDRQVLDDRRDGVKGIDTAVKLNLTPGAVSQRRTKIESMLSKGPF